MAINTDLLKKKVFYVALAGAVVAILALFGFGDEACSVLDFVNIQPEICADVAE